MADLPPPSPLPRPCGDQRGRHVVWTCGTNVAATRATRLPVRGGVVRLVPPVVVSRLASCGPDSETETVCVRPRARLRRETRGRRASAGRAATHA